MCLLRWSGYALLFWAILAISAQRAQETPHTSSATSAQTLEWDFDIGPDLNTTSHLVFDTVSNLFQHWGNTRYRNGHTIALSTVPVGTLLYHGTYKREVPSKPGWIAMDPEHSYMFCQSQPTGARADTDQKPAGCWHLTLTTTRPLKVLYFDGSSAANMEGGPMDSQDILLWGEIKPEWTFQERKRIDELCKWGKELGLDGFVRMEMDFEIMICDLSDGIEMVSFLNLVIGDHKMTYPHPKKPKPSLPPPPSAADNRSSPDKMHVLQRAIEAGTWRNHYPGDRRLHLDPTRLISFYDSERFPSLAAFRIGKERWEHRLEGLDVPDLAVFRARLREIIEQHDGEGSGVDWQTLIQTIIDRYAERLDVLRYLLKTAVGEEDAKAAVGHLRSMLVPYILYTSTPSSASKNRAWAWPVYEYCATTHTRFIASNHQIFAKLTQSEKLLLRSIQGVSKEICRVVAGMWAEGVELGLDIILPSQNAPSMPALGSVMSAVHRWQERTEYLMGWLDWGVWATCRPACEYEEFCYMPTWPFFELRQRRNFRRLEMENELERRLDDDEYVLRPQPICLRRVEPFDM
ncbi:hypothetical protein K443DRAFT_677128 [Laccaria amethystina LaAM-08-1]|uniref:Uncharacterized protein n=1 Tax=Laccaria amethystina LaAM-08-1 TaxID=1095629 RepID=A0A0C9Y4F2_9AGAR|nr:hypothetical protein K443DRAFT_677128 [Laccaria amethystina LaAM-08-1]